MGFWDRVGIRSYTSNPPADETSLRAAASQLAEPGTRETKSVVLGINDTLGALLALGQTGKIASPSAAMQAYENSADVATPVNMIAEAAAETQLILKNMETGERLQRHPLLDLMRRPHAEFSRARFVETAVKYYLIAGECPVVAFGRQGEPPQGLLPINPTWLSANPSQADGLARSWDVTSPAGEGHYVVEEKSVRERRYFAGPLAELKIVKAFSTKDNGLLRGQSRLVSASKMVWQGIQGDDYNLALLQNGGRYSLIFSFKSVMDRDTYKEARAQIREQFGGPSKAGSVIVTQGGDLDVKEGSATARDMEFGEGQRRVMHALFLAYRIPLPLVTIEASTLNNYTTALRAFWDDAVTPSLGRVLGELGEWLMPRFGLDPTKWTLSYDENEVPALLERWLEQLKKRAELGLESINEIRAEMPGRGDAEGGDEILVQGTLVPLSVISDPPEPDPLLDPALLMPGAKKPGKPAGGTEPEDDADPDE